MGGHEFYFGAVNNGGDVFDITATNGNATFDLGPGGQLKVRRGNTVNVASATNTSTIRLLVKDIIPLMSPTGVQHNMGLW